MSQYSCSDIVWSAGDDSACDFTSKFKAKEESNGNGVDAAEKNVLKDKRVVDDATGNNTYCSSSMPPQQQQVCVHAEFSDSFDNLFSLQGGVRPRKDRSDSLKENQQQQDQEQQVRFRELASYPSR